MAKTKTNDKKYPYTMEDICMSVLSVNRFYATILSKIVKVEAPPHAMPTAGVGFNPFGKLTLFYNKDFFLSLPIEKARGVLIHEVLHIFFRHLTRFPIKEIPKGMKDLYNWGLDMAINQYIEHLPEGSMYPETFNLPREKNADFYIDELKKLVQEAMKTCPNCGKDMTQPPQNSQDQQGQGNQQGQKGKGKSKSQKSQDKQEQQDGGGQGQQDQDDQQGQDSQDQVPNKCPHCGQDHSLKGQTLDSHDMWDKVMDEKGDVQDAKDCDIDPEYEVQATVMRSIKECKDYGALPAFIEREIQTLKQMKRHDWKKELKVFVNTVLTSKKKLSQKRVNRRLPDAEYILPGKKKSRNPKLLLVRDTSGSMYDDTVQAELLNEMIHISKSASVLVCDCDTKVHQTYSVRKVSDFKTYKGGGGTSFVAAFEEARKLKVDGIVYLTDTDGEFPDKKNIGKFASHTIWVTFNDSRDVKSKLPFGKHVNIDTSKK